MSAPCTFLIWDSDFFRRRIGRIESHRLDADLLAAIYAWSEQEAIDCLYFHADMAHPPTIRLAEAHGFRLMEARLTLDRRLNDWQSGPIPRTYEDVLIREARAEDLPAIQSIAGISFTTTHFVVDPCFGPEESTAFYQTWVKNGLAGYEDMVLAAEADGEVIGFLTARFLPKGGDDVRPQGQLMLMGIRQAVRRKGLGTEMLRSGIDWLIAKGGSQRVTGVVQAQNIAILRALQRLGFASCGAELLYHKWFSGCGEVR